MKPGAATVGWSAAMGIVFVSTGPDEVVAELEIGPQHLQAFGLVHGGVYAGLIETVASVGAVRAAGRGKSVVGIENHTSFVRAARAGAGKIRAVATPLHRGATTQVWEVAVRDDAGRLLATGRVRLLCTDPTPDGPKAATTPSATLDPSRRDAGADRDPVDAD